MNLQKLVSSEASYAKFKDKTFQIIKNDSDKQNVLRNIVLFCKQVFSSNANQRKKYLCLLLIKDIFENLNSDYYQKLVDEYLALKLLNLVQAHLQGKNRQSKNGNEDKQSSQKVYVFAVETIVFWAKRLSFMQKSIFSQAYDQLKKMKVQIPNNFINYKKQMLIQLWKTQQKQSIKQDYDNPIIAELNNKFKICKDQLQKSINQSVINDQQVNTKPLIETLRDYLLFFFSKYRELQTEQTTQRDVIIVYFHILNNMYKRICNQVHLSIQQMISLTKEIFQAIYPPQYDSVDRMDMIELAGVFKYNALTVFQRIHQRIQRQDALLGSFKININLQQNQKPSLPSNIEHSSSTSRLATNQRFSRTNNNN